MLKTGCALIWLSPWSDSKDVLNAVQQATQKPFHNLEIYYDQWFCMLILKLDTATQCFQLGNSSDFIDRYSWASVFDRQPISALLIVKKSVYFVDAYCIRNRSLKEKLGNASLISSAASLNCSRASLSSCQNWKLLELHLHYTSIGTLKVMG